MRRLGALIGTLALAGAALGGCSSAVFVHVKVEGPTKSEIIVGVDFKGEAGAVIYRSPALQSSLTAAISSNVGRAITLSLTPGDVSWSGPVSYRRLASDSAMTGVGSVILSRGAGGSEKVSVTLVDPTELKKAVLSDAAVGKDSQTLAKTLEAFTTISIGVDFGGGATLLRSSGPHVSVHGGVVLVSQTLSTYQDGSFVVVGTNKSNTHFYALVVVIGVLLISGALVLRRRHTPNM